MNRKYFTEIEKRDALQTQRSVKNLKQSLKRKENREKYLKAQHNYHEMKRFGGNRQACYERDGHKCTKCGSINNLVPHHIDFSGQSENPNHSLENLTTLCKKCHMEVHDPNPNKPNKIERKCLICGKVFYTVLSRIKDGKGKVCSIECKNKYFSIKKTIL